MASQQEQPINNTTDEALELRRQIGRENYYKNREANNERAKAYYHNNKARIKLQHQAKAEQLKEYYKNYYEKNSKTIIARASKSQKLRANSNGESFNSEGVAATGLYVECDCGAKVKKYGLQAHCKTQKHITALASAAANDGCVTRHTITCECGSVVSKRSIYSHRKTAKHQKFMASKSD